MKKLTLSADDDVIEQAKQLAKRQGISVSAMFAGFIRSMAQRDQGKLDIPESSLAARATGYLKLPKGKTPRDVLTAALMEKYGIRKS